MHPNEFSAEPEQSDEARERRKYQLPDVSLSAVAHEAGVLNTLPLSDNHHILGDPYVGVDLRYIPHPTSSIHFQLDQQSANFAERIDAQNADLPEDIPRELDGEQLRHTVTHWQIQNEPRMISTASRPSGAPVSYADAGIDETAMDCTGAYNSFNTPVHPQLIPGQDLVSNDNSSAYRFDVELRSEQQLSQCTVHPNTFHEHVHGFEQQDNTFCNAQGLNYNVLDYAAYGQQPAADLMALTTSHCNTMPSVLNSYHPGNHPFSLMTPAQDQSPQSDLSLQGVGPVPVAARQSPTYTTNNIGYGTTYPFPARSLCNGIANSFSSFPHAITMQELPLILPDGRSATSKIDMTYTSDPSVPTGAIRGNFNQEKRRKSVKGSPYRRTGPGREMENVICYTNPAADQPKVYSQRLDKSKWCCPGCRYSKRKCTILTGDICLRCQNILKTYSWRTAIPKFTCNVRTKFSELSIFTDIPPAGLSFPEILIKLRSSTSFPLKIEFNDGLPPVKLEVSTELTLEVAVEIVLRLFGRIYHLLNILEPLHERQLSATTITPGTIWSYIPSLTRWRSAICFFWPDMKDALNISMSFHHAFHLFRLSELDRVLCKPDANAIRQLNYWYEEISNMKDTTTVDLAAKQHLLSSLVHHLLHVYRIALPTTLLATNSQRQAEIESLAQLGNKFPQTSRLMPAKYRSFPMGHFAHGMMRSHKECSISGEMMIPTIDPTSSQDPSEDIMRCSLLSNYLPAKITDLFDLDTGILNLLEGLVYHHLCQLMSETIRATILEFSSWTLSIGLRTLFERLDFEDCREYRKEALLIGVTVGSLRVWERCIHVYLRSCVPNGATDIGDLIMSDRDILENLMMDWFASDDDCAICNLWSEAKSLRWEFWAQLERTRNTMLVE